MAKSHIFDDDFVRKYRNDVAIIGIGCRFPGADNYHQFWVNMKNGVDSVQEIGERWDVDKFYSTDFNKPNTTNSKWCGKINNIDIFDNSFFNISPREAKNMDPQQRLLLEESWHCIEDSSIPLNYLRKKKTSVYIGVMASDYHQEASTEDVIIDSYAGLGNYNCILANRISYFFGFSGVSMAVDAACASSLVAIHQGRHSLLNMESDYVIAGGVAINTHPWKYISFSKSRMFSPDGRCKTFDKDANGYVPGEGIAVVLMQRVSEAIRDGNHIYGIIKGSAVNHGGATRSITAPRVEAQKDLILTSFKEAAFSPETLTYTEAHGTGTSLGDPIEVEALTRVFKEFLPYEVEYDDFEKNILQKIKNDKDHAFIRSVYIKDKRKARYIFIEDSEENKSRLRKLLLKINYLTHKNGICKIGSVKTNIGHLEAAAGIAGLIKVLMMMKYRQVPPLVHLKTPNPIINWQHTPFILAKELDQWKPARRGLPLRAGVSSFGFGGVNSHLLLEEFPQQYKVAESEKDFFNLFLLSAKSKKSFLKLAEKWKGYLESTNFQKFTLKDICMNLSKGRADFPYRAGIKVKKKGDLEKQLDEIVKLMHKQEDRSWCLRLGEFSWNGYGKIKSLIENHPFNRQILTELEELLERLEYKDDFSKGYRSSKWTKDKIELYTFISGYIFIESLYRLGFKPTVITAERSSVLLGLVSSGIISLQMALEVLTGRRGIKDILFIRPRIPFFDYLSKKTAMPFHFDEEYLKLLVTEVAEKNRLLGQILIDSVYDEEVENNVETRLGALLLRNKIITEEQLNKALELQSSSGQKIGDIIIEQKFCLEETLAECLKQQSILHYYLDEVIYRDKALLLSDSQFTFKRYLEEWDEILGRNGRKISSMMGNKKIITGKEGTSIKEKALLMLIIMSSLKKLNQKWNLTDQKLEEELRFYELIDLVVDNVMPKDLVVELFLEESPDYTKIKHALNIRQKYGNVDKSYTYIRDTNKNIKEVPDTEAWYNAAIKAEPKLAEEIAYIPVNKLSHINFGKVAHPAEDAHIFTPDLTQPLEEAIKDTALQLWMGGTELNWQAFYKDVQYHRLPLPLYAFSGKSFWIKKRESGDKQKGSMETKGAYCYRPCWQEESLKSINKETKSQTLVAFLNKDSLAETFMAQNHGNYSKLYYINQGKNYSRQSNLITIDPAKESDYKKVKELIEKELNHSKNSVDCLYLWSYPAGTKKNIQDDFNKVTQGLFYLAKSLIQGGLKYRVNITVGVQNCFVTDSQDKGGNFTVASLSGMINTIIQENSNIKIKLVDLNKKIGEQEQAKLLLAETEQESADNIIAYRDNKRLIRKVEAISPAKDSGATTIKDDGVYVVIGGAGGIGLKIAGRLTELAKVKVVLVGRKQADESRTKMVDSLSKNGSKVIYLPCNISDMKEVEGLIEATKERFGPINGVIQAGGTLDDKLIVQKEWDSFENVASSKVQGTWNLHRATQKEPLDFFALFSSIVAITGNAGQVDYGAANSFLDAFAYYRNRNNFPGTTVSFNWTLWADGGMGLAPHIVEAFSKKAGVIYSKDGVEAFFNAIDSKLTQCIVVGNSTYFADIGLLKGSRAKGGTTGVDKADTKTHKGSGDASLEGKIESYLLELFSKALEYPADEIDRDEAFFNMGVESIMIQNIMNELQRKFDGLSPTLLFESPNIKSLTEHLKKKEIIEPGFLAEEINEPEHSIDDYIINLFANKLEYNIEDLDREEAFFNMGIESIMIQSIMNELQGRFENLSPTLLFEYPNINLLTAHLKEKKLIGSITIPGGKASTELSDDEMLSLLRQLQSGTIDMTEIEMATEGLYE